MEEDKTGEAAAAKPSEEGADAEMAEGDAGPSGSGGEPAGPAKVWYSDQNTVFVKGLPIKVKESDLEEMFKPCGDIRGIRIPRDSDGNSKVGESMVYPATCQNISPSPSAVAHQYLMAYVHLLLLQAASMP
jgi:RNA recognition motif-containing protein